jgi:uncharacterized protein YndB with AHSA1/START domain
VDKTIEINAPAAKVLDALTKQEHTDEWVSEFSGGDAPFHIESDWQPGSPVLWKGEDGKVVVEGTVTVLTATANEMAGYWDLPMAKHDMKAMLDPQILKAFEQFVNLEQELLALLQKHVAQDQKMLVEMRSAIE